MNLLTEALALALAIALLAGGSAWLQLRSSRAQVLELQATSATARADAALCSSATQELVRQGEVQTARLRAAEKAARATARVAHLVNAPKAGDGCAKAAAWAVEQAPALVNAWESVK